VAERRARRSHFERSTRETSVDARLTLDGTGTTAVKTGIGFLDHMVATLAGHALFDLYLRARGDLQVDAHHTVEDVAITLGTALNQALGTRSGLRRFGHGMVPLDEALATAVVDAGGRSYCQVTIAFPPEPIGGLEGGMLVHFFDTFARAAGLVLHVQANGTVGHHIAEAAFKALALALRAACERDPRRRGMASTKGRVRTR
jgi:imidazoleglycerol-phosphate dehydratase